MKSKGFRGFLGAMGPGGRVASVLVLAAALALGCGSGVVVGVDPVGPEAGPDADASARGDAALDAAGPDAGLDAATDAARDAGPPLVVGLPSVESATHRAEFIAYDAFRASLADAGLVLDLLEEPVSAAEVYGFHAILYPTREEHVFYRLDDFGVMERMARERAALEAFVRAGGGLVLLLVGSRYPGSQTVEYYNGVLQDFGIEILREGIWDPSHAFVARGTPTFRDRLFFKTTNLAEHAITEGVQRLALPKHHHDAKPGVEAVRFHDSALPGACRWQVVVAGEATARTYGIDPDGLLDDERPTETFPSAPPIAAVCAYGAGRIVAYSAPAIYTTLNFGRPSWPHTTELRGDETTDPPEPSDGHRFLQNAVRWAAEGALGRPGFGTRVVPERFEPISYPAERTPALEPLPWEGAGPFDAPLPAPRNAPRRGVIGAHTARSVDGEGEVLGWREAARALGLRFVVFTENLEDLTRAEWDSLVSECQSLSDADVLLVPGYEYSDRHDLRWALWGRTVIYPDEDMLEGGKVRRYGDLVTRSAYAQGMLLDYDGLTEVADYSNLWWHFRFPVFVYDEHGGLVDQSAWYRRSLEDLRLLPVTCFTRVLDPASLGAAAARCTTNLHAWAGDTQSAISNAFTTLNSQSYVSQGGATGPQVEMFLAQGRESQMDENVYLTAGTQRSRWFFEVYVPESAPADVALAEVVVHDGDRGPIRRFLPPPGARRYRELFELVHDRQHPLVLEVVDTLGRRAVWSHYRMYSYKQGLYRCGDNLNLLGSTPSSAHPDRHDYPSFPLFSAAPIVALRGFDTSSGGLVSQPIGVPFEMNLSFDDGSEGPYVDPGDGAYRIYGRPARVRLGSYGVSVWDAATTGYVRVVDDAIVYGPVLPRAEPTRYADIHRRTYMLRDRLDYYTTWDHRRPIEGAREFRGSVFVQEGELVMKRDAVLSPAIDPPLLLTGVTNDHGTASEDGLFDTLVVEDGARGERVIRYEELRSTLDCPFGDPEACAGALPKGGYATGLPTDAGVLVVVSAMDGLRYGISSRSDHTLSTWNVRVGIGEPGAALRAGDRLPFRYLAAALPNRPGFDVRAALPRLGAELGLRDGGYSCVAPGPRPCDLWIGSEEDTEVFYTAVAEGHELEVEFAPRPMSIDQPFRVRGLVENGTAAVFVLEGEGPVLSRQRRFRFVPVFEGAAVFQQRIDEGARLWVGNLFVDPAHPELRMTPVLDGLRPEEPPFLELHNPTDVAVTAELASPEHIPTSLRGFRATALVPAGASVRLPLPVP